MPLPASLPRSLQVLLTRVSRSFGLSLRLLPPEVRPVISLAYLLARTSDTLADAARVPVAKRVEALQTLLAQLGAPGLPAALPLEPFLQAQLPDAERVLLTQWPHCLNALTQLPASDQDNIRKVLAPIGEGQLRDLERGAQPLATLATENELDTYTWQVAGCVGRFWTDCLHSHLPRTLVLPVEEMQTLGERYGQGLQRLNILLDAAQDLRNGRCYFPVQSLQNLGLSPERLQQASQTHDTTTLAQLAPLQAQWFDQIEHALRDGLRYSCALATWRLRLASALPALVGAASLHLLRQQPTASLTRRLKWPRSALQMHLLRLLLQGARPRALQQQFERLLHGKAAPRNATITP